MKVNFSDEALQDLEVLRRYLEDRDPGAAESYGKRLDNAFSLLEEFPRIGPEGEVPGTREYKTISPYVIIYEIDAEDDDAGTGGQLTVLNVWRGERDRAGRT